MSARNRSKPVPILGSDRDTQRLRAPGYKSPARRPSRGQRNRRYSVHAHGQWWRGLNATDTYAMLRETSVTAVQIEDRDLEQCCGFWGGYAEQPMGGPHRSHHRLEEGIACDSCGREVEA